MEYCFGHQVPRWAVNMSKARCRGGEPEAVRKPPCPKMFAGGRKGSDGIARQARRLGAHRQAWRGGRPIGGTLSTGSQEANRGARTPNR